MKELSRKDLENIVRGCCFMGSGGGGGYTNAMELMNQMEKDSFQLASVSDLKDSTKCGVVVACLGAPKKMNCPDIPDSLVEAAKRLCKEKGREQPDYIISAELGAINTMLPCVVASKLDVPVLDLDGAGRAVPTLGLLTYSSLSGTSVNPTVVSSGKDSKGNHHQVVLQISENSPATMEALVRPVVSLPEFDGKGGLAIWYLDDITKLKEPDACIPGTISQSLELGREIEKLQQIQQPLIADIIPVFDKIFANRKIKEICSGTILEACNTTGGGFDCGTITIQNGKRIYRIVFQNECLILWDSEEGTPLVMAPDTITYMIVKNGGGTQQLVYTNDDIIEDNKLREDMTGASITVFGITAEEALIKTEKRLEQELKKRLCGCAGNSSQGSLLNNYMITLNALGYYGKYIPLE